MSIKGVSATKGIFRHFASTARSHFESQNSDAASNNANPAITVYLLQQQEKRFIKQKDSLKTETH